MCTNDNDLSNYYNINLDLNSINNVIYALIFKHIINRHIEDWKGKNVKFVISSGFDAMFGDNISAGQNKANDTIGYLTCDIFTPMKF